MKGSLALRNGASTVQQPLMAHTDAARWLLHHLKEKGYSRQLADWLGSSLKATGGANPEERTWLFDVEGASALYDAYRSVHLHLDF